MTTTFFWILIGCSLVTLLPRILPFILVRQFHLPDVFLRWLAYIPVCILTALVVSELLIDTETFSIQLNSTAILAIIPTLIIAVLTKSLTFTVITGVVAMALIRLYM